MPIFVINTNSFFFSKKGKQEELRKLGNKIAELRKNANQSCTAAANELDIAKSTLCKIETGQCINFEVVCKVAYYYDIQIVLSREEKIAELEAIYNAHEAAKQIDDAIRNLTEASRSLKMVSG